MIKQAALFLSLSLLTSCATPSSPEPPHAAAPDPQLCADLDPEPPVVGQIIRPATEAARAATAVFLDGEAQARDWGREGWRRAGIARRACPSAANTVASSPH